MDTINLQAYAKINLSLDVLRKREDGYHDVRMIMQSIRVHDQVDIKRLKTRGISLRCNLPFLPTGEGNLMYRAAKLLMDEFQITEGVEMKLRKVIPVAAGLAGGSSDAAAVLVGINQLFSLGLSIEELQKRGVSLGADIPFCLMRGTALSEGIGEKLTLLKDMPACSIVLVKPDISVSTKYVYENLHVNERKREEHPDVSKVLDAIETSDLNLLTSSMGNILETVTVAHYPIIENIKEKLLSYGALSALMSGSGPSVFAIFDDPEKAEHTYREFRFGKERELAKQAFLTAPWQRKA